MAKQGKQGSGAGGASSDASPAALKPASHTISKALRWRSLFLALCMLAVLCLTYFLPPTSQGWQQLELLGTVLRFNVRGQVPMDDTVRILGINQQFISSVAEYGENYPFARDLHAVVLRRLADAGAKVVVVDILFSEEGTWDVSEDGALRDAISYCREHGCQVVLAAGIDVSKMAGATSQQLLLPAPAIMEANPRLGLSNVGEKLSFRMQEQGGFRSDEFGLEGWIDSQPWAAWYALKSAEGLQFKRGYKPPFNINYACKVNEYSGYLYNLETVIPESFDASKWNGLSDSRNAMKTGGVYTPTGPADLGSAFKGKVVFYGSHNSADNDYFNTPFGQMFGVDTIAESFDTILRDRALRPLPTWSLLLIGIASTIAAWWLSLARPLRNAVFLGPVLLIAIWFINQGQFRANGDIPLAFHLATFLLPFLACTIYGGSVEEAERRKIRATFGRYMSDELVAQLVEDPKLADLGGQRLDVAVMFCDVRNYSTLTEHLEPHWTVLMLNIFLGAMTQVIRRHGGFIDKYMGDGLLVCFGGPVPLANPAQNSVAAALEMVKVLYEEVHPRLIQDNLPPLRIGIGIHFGPVVMGNIGSESRMDFTVVGDSVNVAARVEGCTKEEGWAVLVTREVVEASPQFKFELVGEQHVKGRVQGVELYRPVSEELGERLKL
jgi:class 3 adenylate cyclase/CHASE2 domain-containing sensor protein